jgi:hypothetical protein
MAGLDPAIYACATHWIDASDGVDHRLTVQESDWNCGRLITRNCQRKLFDDVRCAAR